MTTDPKTLAERLRDASRNEKSISTYARLCREAADALEALSVQPEAGASKWPAGCNDPDSCARHRACMYLRCKLSDQDVIDALDATPPAAQPQEGES